MNPVSARSLGALIIFGCGLGGYAAGGGFGGTAKVTALETDGNRRHERGGLPARRIDLDDFGKFEELLKEGSETDIWKTVSRLPRERMPDAIRRLKEIEAVTATGSPEYLLRDIKSALYFHWAEMDPRAALADVVAIPKSTDQDERARKGLLMTSVLTAWMRTDPDAAFRAVKDDENLEYYGRDLIVKLWTPENVFENLKKYPENHQLLLGWYCGENANDTVKRNAMLQALKEQPDMKDRDWAYMLLFRGWGYEDFDAAMAEAESQKRTGTVTQLMQDNLNRNPDKVLRWAAAKDIPPGGPLWEDGYRYWLNFDKPAAKDWFEKQAPLWESKGYHSTVAGFMAKQLAIGQAANSAGEK
ncbi:MAG: hypothetical protein EOP87_23225, partial [Verrucomicrobiaceae bacterium]